MFLLYVLKLFKKNYNRLNYKRFNLKPLILYERLASRPFKSFMDSHIILKPYSLSLIARKGINVNITYKTG